MSNPTAEKLSMDPRAIEPYNRWWRELSRKGDPRNVPNISTQAFAAGFKAGLQCGVDGAIAVLNGTKP